MVKFPTLAAITYFSLNVFFLLILSVWVFVSGSHTSLKSTSFIKDLWSQRKILGPILVHFYDTATDIGVLLYWAQLMIIEQNNETDFQSVNIQNFFWWGLSLLLLYRCIVLLMIINASLTTSRQQVHWYDVVLVLLDMYILKRVYISFETAKVKRANKVKRKKQNKEVELQMTAIIADEVTDEVTAAVPQSISISDDEESDSIEPDDFQNGLLMLEAIIESMPQIIFQTVFIIRSANDVYLKAAGSNDALLILSVVASLISIANKFATIMDADRFNEGADSLKPRKTFPDCIQYWYVVRMIWRVCDIMSRFVVFALVWTVMGGAWLGVWICLVFIYWAFGVVSFGYNAGPFSLALGVYGPPIFHVMKYIESTVGLSIITIFATLEFDCMICADAKERQLTNPNNNRILIFLGMGWGSFLLEIITYIVLVCNGKIKKS